MAKKSWARQMGAVLRKDGPKFFLLNVISFAASIGLVRLYLNLTGFPRIGSGPVHISHVLWGGLLLFVAALLVLVIDYRKVYIASAILAGAGMGLFIDEVGKFITSDYNYFIPIAAPIVYAFFLVTLLAYQRIRRLPGRSLARKMNQALESIQQDLVEPLSPKETRQVITQLGEVAKGSPAERRTHLAQLLLGYLQQEDPRPIRRSFWQRTKGRWQRWLQEGRLRGLLVFGLLAMGLWTLKNVLEFIPWLPINIQALLHSFRLGPETSYDSTWVVYQLRQGLEAVCGLSFLAAAVLLALRRASKALVLAYLAELLSFFVLNLLIFYYEQFSTIFLVLVQFLLLAGLVTYQRRFEAFQEPVRRVTRGWLNWVERVTR